MARGWSKSRVRPYGGRGGRGGRVRSEMSSYETRPRKIHALSSVFDTPGVDSVKMISLVTLAESRIDPILISG